MSEEPRPKNNVRDEDSEDMKAALDYLDKEAAVRPDDAGRMDAREAAAQIRDQIMLEPCREKPMLPRDLGQVDSIRRVENGWVVVVNENEEFVFVRWHEFIRFIEGVLGGPEVPPLMTLNPTNIS